MKKPKGKMVDLLMAATCALVGFDAPVCAIYGIIVLWRDSLIPRFPAILVTMTLLGISAGGFIMFVGAAHFWKSFMEGE